MNDLNDQDLDAKLDAMLRRHLSRELDPHVGSAMAKFDAAREEDRVRPSRLRIGLRWSAAAMILIGLGAVGSVAYHQARRPAVKVDDPIAIDTHNASSNAPSNAIVTSWTETYDGGTVLVDPKTPARMLRRVQYEEKKWKDQKTGQWQSRITVPQQDVILVDLVKQ